MQRQNGFTLVEMLIVIAVIGLLSSFLLTALGPARASARDARIIQEVNQARSLAETLYDGSYNKLPVIQGADSIEILENQDLKKLASDIYAFGGELIIRKTSRPEPAYVIYSKVNTMVGDAQNPITNFYCADSRGNTGYTSNEPVTDSKCF